METKKIVFIAFAIEDVRQRDFLKGQTKLGHCTFEYVDMSVKEAYLNDWKEKVRTRIRRSNGIIVLVSKNSLNSSGQQWEIQCAKEEKKPILAIWAYSDDRTVLSGLQTKVWNWVTIGDFIDNL